MSATRPGRPAEIRLVSDRNGLIPGRRPEKLSQWPLFVKADVQIVGRNNRRALRRM